MCFLLHFPQVAGGRNVPVAVKAVAKASIDQSREMKYQSLNEYRKRFSLKPYTSFEELTGERWFLKFLKGSRIKWEKRKVRENLVRGEPPPFLPLPFPRPPPSFLLFKDSVD